MSGIDSDVATAPHAYRAPRKLTPAAWLGSNPDRTVSRRSAG